MRRRAALARYGSTPTPRELQLFHAWLRQGTADSAGQQLECSATNVTVALGRLKDRYGVDHSVQLVHPILLSPLYARIRRLEERNRALQTFIRDDLAEFRPQHRRHKDGGSHLRPKARRFKQTRRKAKARGFLLE